MDIKIRVAEVSDVEVLTSLVPHVHDLHLAERPEHFQKLQRDHVVIWFMSMLQSREVRAWIAELHGSPVGYVLTYVRQHAGNQFVSARRVCEIDAIAVSPSARRRGIARLLVEQVLANAREMQIQDVELSCWAFNSDAQAVLAKLGFKPKTIRYERSSA
jgi:ribosomal protein S18 acetylase RimI-like enzyme